MYKKILIPTDGSDISVYAAHKGVALARELGAEIVAFHVAPEYQPPVYAEVIPPDFPSRERHNAEMIKTGESYLSDVEKAASAAGVKFSGKTVISDRPAQAIVAAADQMQCDLIFMGSHGRSGWERFLVGSVTSKVLTLCHVPVLVYRLKEGALPA